MSEETNYSAMASYVQKALARNDKAKANEISKSEIKPVSKKCQTQECSKWIKSIKEDLNVLSSKILTVPKLDVSEVEGMLNRKDILDKATKRQVFNRAAIKVTAIVVKDLTMICNPTQSIINIMIALICALKPFDEGNKLHAKHKIYPNCTEPLKNGKYISKIILKTVDLIETTKEEHKFKLQKIRGKYLVGWDMTPAAFSDKYSSARLVLTYLLILCSYAENNSSGDILLYKEPVVEDNRRKIKRAHSEEKNGIKCKKSTVCNKSSCITPIKRESGAAYNTTRINSIRTGLRKSNDEVVYNLLKVVCVLISIEVKKY